MFLHRDVLNAANAKMVVFVRPELHAIAWLTGRKTKFERLPKDGDRERGQIVSELTIENRGQAAEAAIGGFTS